MKISEIKEKRIIHRPTRNFDKLGNRIYQEFEYDFNFKTRTDENYFVRLLAKIIDLVPIFLIFNFILEKNSSMIFFCSIFTFVILNAILEWKTGQTLGKRIFNLKVVDEYGNYPKFTKSILRNFLFFLNLVPEFYDYQDKSGVWGTRMKFSMDVNNRICKTYVLKQKIYEEIIKILNNKNVA